MTDTAAPPAPCTCPAAEALVRVRAVCRSLAACQYQRSFAVAAREILDAITPPEESR